MLKSAHCLDEVQSVITENELSLLYISAPNCGVCHAILPKLENMLSLLPEIATVQADIAQIPEMASVFHALTVPVAIMFYQGKEVWRMAKFFRFAELESELDRWVNFANA
ncbi:thiol reductase thioredoxin [Neisseria chenwenguii]|uniref:Thiol reductase thioredoxin n=1 Tax=Neisseria chenwenguii TaxID=1853278 RepID=A0A220S1H7_9NEIS|nr:thioredoxin family protein [Neisseria chenwenguii]ASK27360.1 thiol reductase thioredoxin [Neisseria chenwenguii]